MRKANETTQADADLRATFIVPRALADEFRLVAKRNQRTLSGELRKMMEDAVARAKEAA